MKRVGGREGSVKLWIEAAARELAKTIPLHIETHRIYHSVIENTAVMERRFQNYPVKVNDAGEMEVLEA